MTVSVTFAVLSAFYLLRCWQVHRIHIEAGTQGVPFFMSVSFHGQPHFHHTYSYDALSEQIIGGVSAVNIETYETTRCVHLFQNRVAEYSVMYFAARDQNEQIGQSSYSIDIFKPTYTSCVFAAETREYAQWAE